MEDCVKEVKNELLCESMNTCGMLAERCDRYFSFAMDDPAMCLSLIKGVLDAGGKVTSVEYERYNKEFVVYYKVENK